VSVSVGIEQDPVHMVKQNAYASPYNYLSAHLSARNRFTETRARSTVSVNQRFRQKITSGRLDTGYNRANKSSQQLIHNRGIDRAEIGAEGTTPMPLL